MRAEGGGGGGGSEARRAGGVCARQEVMENEVLRRGAFAAVSVPVRGT